MSKAFRSGLNRALLLGEVRLIRLLPGQCSDEICCEHIYAFLPQKPFYQALSYVWGSQKVSRPVILNGEEHSVTINLHSALRHLRHQTEVTILWIDALCINQADVSERTHQVRFMGEIYQSAANVLVYLGDRIDRTERTKFMHCSSPIVFHGDGRDSNKLDTFYQEYLNVGDRKKMNKFRADHDYTFDVFCLIRLLAENKHVGTLPFGAKENLHGGNRRDRLFDALRRLMHGPCTPWWSRIWVVQEIVLPRQVTMIYGRVSAPWTMFAKAAFNYAEHIHSCCSRTIESLPRDCLKVLADFSQRVRDIEVLRASFLDHSPDTRKLQAREHTFIDAESICGDVKEEKQSLLSLLRRFRSRKATDPRDKVYALLGLATTKVVPDYSLSISQVFTDTVIDSIMSTRSLSVLTADQGRKFRQDLPTWVPDWEAPEDYTQRIWVEALDLYDASGEPILIPKVEGNGRILLIEGDCKDTIKQVGEIMSTDNVNVSHDILLEWLNTAWKHESLGPQGKIRLTWNLLCADVICSQSDGVPKRGYRRTESEDDFRFELWALHAERSPFRRHRHDGLLAQLLSRDSGKWNEDEPAGTSPEKLNSIAMIDASIMSATMNRRLFTTFNGYIGLGPADTKPGDKLFLVEGGRAPFVLRENRDKPECKEILRERKHPGSRQKRVLGVVWGELAPHVRKELSLALQEGLSQVLQEEPFQAIQGLSQVLQQGLSQVLQQELPRVLRESFQAPQELSRLLQGGLSRVLQGGLSRVLQELSQVLQQGLSQMLQEELSQAPQQGLPRVFQQELLRMLQQKLYRVLQQKLPRVIREELSQALQQALSRVLQQVLPRVLQQKLPRVLQQKLSRALQQELSRALHEIGQFLSHNGEGYKELQNFHKECEKFLRYKSVQQSHREFLLWQQLLLARLEEFYKELPDLQNFSERLRITGLRELEQEIPEPSENFYPVFELVGACYTQGLMDFNQTYTDIHWQTFALV